MPTFIFSIPPSNNFIFGQQPINNIVLESNSLLIQGPTGNNGLTGATGPIGVTGPPGDGGLPAVLSVDPHTSTYSIIVNNNVNASAMASITNDYAIGAGNDPNLYGSGGASIKSLIHFTPDGSAMTLITQDVNVNSETIQMNPGSGTEIVSIDANSNFSETLTAPTGIDLQTLKFDGTLGSELKLKNNAQFTGFAFELSGFDNSSNGNRGSVYFDGVDGNTVLQYGLYDNSAITSVRPSLRSVAIGSTNPSLGFHGAVYDADYSSHYSLRSLITLQDLLTFSASQIAPTLQGVLASGNNTGTYSIQLNGNSQIIVDDTSGFTPTAVYRNIDTGYGFWIGTGDNSDLGLANTFARTNYSAGGISTDVYDGTNFMGFDLDTSHGLSIFCSHIGQSVEFDLTPTGVMQLFSNWTTFKGLQYEASTEALVGTNQVGTSILDRNLNDLRYLMSASYSIPTLQSVLAQGNNTNGNNIIVSQSDQIQSTTALASIGFFEIVPIGYGLSGIINTSATKLDFQAVPTSGLPEEISLDGNKKQILISSNFLQINGLSATFSGAQYQTDYSAHYTTHSLITLYDLNHAISTATSSLITLNSLSGITPIVYNNTTGNFSILQSGNTQSGYLSTTDWNTFNNKPVFASFSAVSPIVYNGSGQYSILQSTSTQSGYLSSTDWNTFNNKVSSLKEKANTILAASFSSNGTSLIYPVTFSTPYSNSNYSISIQGQDERTFTYTSKATTGFTIDSNSVTALSGNVDFITMAYGEN